VRTSGSSGSGSVGAERPRVLFVATVDNHLEHFHLPAMALLRDMGYDVEAAAGSSGFAERIRSQGFAVTTLPFSKRLLNPGNLVAGWRLLRMMRKRQYVLVHAHTPIAGVFARMAAHSARVPHVIYTAHGFHFHAHGRGVSNAFFLWAERVAARWTDVLITLNAEDFAVARSTMTSAKTRVEYVPGVGVDTVRYRPASDVEREHARGALGVADATFVVGWIGEIVRGKRPEDALEVMRLLAGAEPGSRLLMAGVGRLEGTIGREVAKSGLSPSVRLMGWVEDVPRFLHCCDVLMMTSEREGLPKCLMEAMSSGLPVVAWDIRGCRDLIRQGENGFLVPFGDCSKMAARLHELAVNGALRASMGAAGRERVVADLGLDSILSRMKDIYARELSRGTA